MELSPAILSSATNQLQKIFDVETLPASDQHTLLYKLSYVVAHLLRTDLNRLLHILYRIDVNEQQVKQAMTAEDEETIAEQLARLIIKREMQKAYTRLKYSSK